MPVNVFPESSTLPRVVLLDGTPTCRVCQVALWECPSCGDQQCACFIAWLRKLKPADRRIAPHQHYQKVTLEPYPSIFGDFDDWL